MKKTITNYFLPSRNVSDDAGEDPDITLNSVQGDTSSSEDSDDFDETAFIKNHADRKIADYEAVLRKNKSAKSVAKISLTERKGTGSLAWNFFGTLTLQEKPVLQKFRFCKLCFEKEHTTLKGFSVGTSTSNHITHLRSVHDMEIKTKNTEQNLQITNKALSGSSSNFYRSKGEAKFITGRRIAEMCCTDLQSFNIVERQGFQKFVLELKPEIELPRSRTIATTALHDVYKVYENIVKQELKNAPNNISLVLDLWTDNYKHLSYVNIKVHYCTKFKIISTSLKTEYFPHPHTGSRIADTVMNSLKEFNLEQRTIHAVSDGGSNIVSAIRLAHIVRYECMAHSLHRFLVHDVLENEKFGSIKEVVKKLKKTFKTLSYATEELATIQKACHQDQLMSILIETVEIAESLQLEEEYGISVPNIDSNLLLELQKKYPTSIKNSNDTRWNTLLSMFRSFSNNFDTINIALIKAGKETFLFQEMEKKKIKEFTEFLAIFEKATVYLQGRNYPTICSVIVFYENIITSITKHEEEAEFGTSIEIYEFAKINFKKRFKIKKIHVIAAFMDPCQRNWAVLDKWLKKIPKDEFMELNEVLDHDVDEGISKNQLIYEEVTKLLNNFPRNRNDNLVMDEPQPIKKAKLSATRKDMLQFLASTSAKNKNDDDLNKEIQGYFDASNEETECLEWWQQKQEIFPRLAKLAEFCFGIPATSASSEEAFSVAGACITAKRSRLNPSTAKRQLFVHDNQHLVEPILKNQ